MVSASLIVNGSFEALSFNDNGISTGIVFNTNLQAFENKNRGWNVFHALPDWITTNSNGIELQKSIVAKSADGNHHVELDSHPRGSSNTVMTQSLDSLVIGNKYLLEFSYKARTNLLNDNGINVFWYDAKTDFNLNMNADFAVDGTKTQKPNWATQSIVLTSQSTTMDLSLALLADKTRWAPYLMIYRKYKSITVRPSMYLNHLHSRYYYLT